MNRKDKILKHVNRNGHGIEIGPCHNPAAPKKDGYKVHIIDHMNREQLMTNFKDHGINLNNIEEVDFVWKGESYSELTGKRKYYDWIIASHVIEHTPDLIGFLDNCETILKDDGVISLVVPDKRYCFDHYRPITGISKILDNHFQKRKTHTPGAVAEHFLNFSLKAEKIAWDSSTTGTYTLVNSLENVLQEMESAFNVNVFRDVHAWCFVPHSFRLIIHDLFCFGQIPFQEVEFYPTEGCEFYVTISRNGKGVGKSRLEMLEIIESEIEEVIAPFKSLRIKSKNIVKRLTSRFS